MALQMKLFKNTLNKTMHLKVSLQRNTYNIIFLCITNYNSTTLTLFFEDNVVIFMCITSFTEIEYTAFISI